MENAFNILIADDDSTVYSASIKPFMRDIPEAKIYSAATPALCRQMMAGQQFQFILLDISFGSNDLSGFALLTEFRQAQPNSKIIMLSTHDDHLTMMNCMSAGATDFISKRDIDISHIAKIIRGFIQSQGQERHDEATGLRLAEMVGARFASDSMRRVFALAALAQRSRGTPVLITGETGVGKDVVANAIASVDMKRPLVSVDCGAIAESVAESELFGHERGSFTGADRTTLGKFRAAQGGDLFLDEIGNLKRSIQEKLLRAIQNKEVTPVGGKAVKVDARVIAATNEDLEKQSTIGNFRKDLLERLKGIVIHIPPLRDRPEDIAVIANGVIASSDKPTLVIAPACMSLLTAYSWPGNVRELEHVVNAMVSAAANSPITVRQLPQQFMRALSNEMQRQTGTLPIEGPSLRIEIPLDTELLVAENHFLKAFLEARQQQLRVKPSSVELAEKLNISRTTLRKYVKRLGLAEPGAEA
ncbi:MAG: sigma-54-dependent transcriptional regulator [Oligoflexales bacterium]